MTELKHKLRYLNDRIEANSEMKTFLEHMFWKEATACMWHTYDSQACETYCGHPGVLKEIHQLDVCPDCSYYKVQGSSGSEQ